MSNGMELQVVDVRQHAALLGQQAERLEKWCTSGDVRSDALIRFALHEMELDEKLRACTPTSIYLALLACAVTGLVPGKLRGHAFLVPFNNAHGEVKRMEATFMIGWRGVKHQGFRCGLDLLSAVIHANDDFDFDKGTACFVRYKQALKGAGPVIGTAAWCKLPRGGLEIEYLDIDTLTKIEANAQRRGPSPAWRSDFKDQMQRKSALRRLGKQIEMGEEFFRGEQIENGYAETGSIASALDVITQGEATQALTRQSTESAAFGHLPRPAQVQVVGQRNAAGHVTQAGGGSGGSTTPSEAKLQAATEKARAADKGRAERPTQAAAGPTSSADSQRGASTGGAPPSSSGANASGRPPNTGHSFNYVAESAEHGRVDTSNPTSSAGPASPAASPATPAASSPSSSNTAPAASPASPAAPTSTPSSSSASADPSPQGEPSPGEFGDVAGEPSPDGDFDTSFGDEVETRPATPTTRAEWVAAFNRWTEAHPTRAEVYEDWGWFEIFQGWAASCKSKEELDADKPVFLSWTRALKLSAGHKGDAAKGIAPAPPDPQIAKMQDAFASRYKAVP